jgi:hypothetical protein
VRSTILSPRTRRVVLPTIDPIIVVAGSPPLHDPLWIYEPKFDGFRAVLYVCGRECYIRSKPTGRRPFLTCGISWTAWRFEPAGRRERFGRGHSESPRHRSPADAGPRCPGVTLDSGEGARSRLARYAGGGIRSARRGASPFRGGRVSSRAALRLGRPRLGSKACYGRASDEPDPCLGARKVRINGPSAYGSGPGRYYIEKMQYRNRLPSRTDP